MSTLDREPVLAAMDAPDPRAMAHGVLGGQDGGTYLAAALYQPVVEVCACFSSTSSCDGGVVSLQAWQGVSQVQAT